MLYLGVRCLIRLFSSASASTTESVTITSRRDDLVEQRVGLGIDAVGAEIVADAVAQRPRLADVNRVAGRVEVQIDPGLLGQPGDLLLEFVDGHTLLCRVSCQVPEPSIIRAIVTAHDRPDRRSDSRMTFTGRDRRRLHVPAARASSTLCVALRIHPNTLTLIGVHHQRRRGVGARLRPVRAGRRDHDRRQHLRLHRRQGRAPAAAAVASSARSGTRRSIASPISRC